MSNFKELQEAGGHVAQFFPLIMPLVNPRTNYRLHRKIVVIDGIIGYTGGFNVGDEYASITKKFGYWRDNHLRLTGDIVYSLQPVSYTHLDVYKRQSARRSRFDFS